MDDNEIAKIVREEIAENLKPSETRLKEDFAERFKAIVGKGSMDALRNLQAEFQEKGLSESDVDVAPKGNAVERGRPNDLPGR